MTAVHTERAATKRAAIQAIYTALRVPDWAATNLDALADVLRDLSWLPDGPIELHWHVAPELPVTDRESIERVLRRAASESVRSRHPVQLSVES